MDSSSFIDFAKFQDFTFKAIGMMTKILEVSTSRDETIVKWMDKKQEWMKIECKMTATMIKKIDILDGQLKDTRQRLKIKRGSLSYYIDDRLAMGKSLAILIQRFLYL